MSQAMTSVETIYGRAGFPGRTMQHVPAANGGKPSRHRGQAIARVPTLDWPVDLFGDNATLPELVTVDFLLQCDPVDGHHTSH